jgi:hypothetical protein
VYNRAGLRYLPPSRFKHYHAKVTRNLKRLLAAIATASIILTALVLPANSQRKGEVVTLPFSEAPYRVGERLTYNVSFSNFMSAAHVELFVAARGTFFGRDAIDLRAHVETTGVVSAALYALNNDYTTYVDPGTGLPFRAQEVVREAARTSDTSSDFNQPARTSAIPDKPAAAGFAGTYDFLAALYRLRALPLSEDSTYPFTVRAGSQEYQAELKVKGHEMIRTNVGSFNAIVSEIRVPNNSAANDYRIRIYFSDDERHVPILVTAKVRSGEIRAEIAGSQLLPEAPAKQPPPARVAVAPPQSPPLTGAGSPIADDVLAALPFKVGEQLNYQVYLGGNQEVVGLASFQVRARSRYFDHDGLMFTVSAQTTNAAQRLFFANDQLTSYIDPKTLLPFRTELKLAEGQKRTTESLTINQDYGTAISDKGQKIEIPVGTHDCLSIFYAIRAMNLTPPKRSALSILVNSRPKTLFISSLLRETIQFGSQKLRAIQLSLTTDDPQSDKFALRAWISDDDRRLPLRFTATTQLGPLRADLVILPVTPN